MSAPASISAHVCTPAITASLQQLMEACQAQAAASAASLPAGDMVLAGAVHNPRVRQSADMLVIYNLDGDEDRYCRRRVCPAGWQGLAINWHPSYWFANHDRIDKQGETWSRSGGPYITDDFGLLVPVEGAA